MIKTFLKVKTINSYFRNSLYARYSHSDWNASNNANFQQSHKDRNFAESLRADCWQAVKVTDARTRNRQNDSTKKLGKTNKKSPHELIT